MGKGARAHEAAPAATGIETHTDGAAAVRGGGGHVREVMSGYKWSSAVISGHREWPSERSHRGDSRPRCTGVFGAVMAISHATHMRRLSLV